MPRPVHYPGKGRKESRKPCRRLTRVTIVIRRDLYGYRVIDSIHRPFVIRFFFFLPISAFLWQDLLEVWKKTSLNDVVSSRWRKIKLRGFFSWSAFAAEKKLTSLSRLKMRMQSRAMVMSLWSTWLTSEHAICRTRDVYGHKIIGDFLFRFSWLSFVAIVSFLSRSLPS